MSWRTTKPAEPTEDIVLACAADDGFALPLATTVASVLDHLAPGRKLSLYILDGAISAENRRRLEACWSPDRLTCHWIQLPAERLAGLPISGHINPLTYFRLLLPTVLPESMSKAIYLDSDVIVLSDLAGLWNLPLDGHLCLAAPDVACPCIDASKALPNYRRCAEYLASVRPIRNHARLGIPATAGYFNGGVMVIDLKRWRDADLAQRFLRCLGENRRYVKYWDQYALNVVLAGRWGKLDVRWNQGAHIYRYPSWKESPFDQPQYQQIVMDPYVVHFSSPSKPWHYDCAHPYRDRFYEYLDRTAWRGWRPASPPPDWRRELSARIDRAILFAGRKYRYLRAQFGI